MAVLFQITEDDIQQVLKKSGIGPVDDNVLINIMRSLDHEHISKAALCMDTFEDQFISARAEIELQLQELGFI